MNLKTISLLQLIFSMCFLAGIVISLINLLSTSGIVFLEGSTNTPVILAVYTSGFLAVCFGYINAKDANLVKRKEDIGLSFNNKKSEANEVEEHENTQVDSSKISSEIDKILKSDADKKVKVEKVLSVL